MYFVALCEVGGERKPGPKERWQKSTQQSDNDAKWRRVRGLVWRGGTKTAKGLSTHTFKIQPHTFYDPICELGATFAIRDGKPSSHSLRLNGAHQLASRIAWECPKGCQSLLKELWTKSAGVSEEPFSALWPIEWGEKA